MTLSQKIKKAVFPIAGIGSRLGSITKSIPKEMLPVATKPLIEYAFNEAKSAGIEQFIFIIGNNKSCIVENFDRLKESGIDIIFIKQNQPLGLGHAVWHARDVVGNESFAVLLPDELFFNNKNSAGILSQMLSEFRGENLVAVAEIDPIDSNKYGIIKLSEDCKAIIDMVEKPSPQEAPSTLAIVGRYVLTPQVFEYLDNIEAGVGGEIQLTDAMRQMLRDDHKYHAFKTNYNRVDCGSYLGFLEANLRSALQTPEFRETTKQMLQKILSA